MLKKNGRKTKKVIISLIVLLLIISSVPIYPHSLGTGSAMENGDGWRVPDLMNPQSLMDFMPEIGQDPVPVPDPEQGIQPSLPPAAQGDMTPAVAPNFREYDPQDLEIPTPSFDHPVNLVTGKLDLSSIDLQLPGIGMDYVFERTYMDDLDETGELGEGWLANVNSELRIYEGYHMGETRLDGSVHTH